MASDIVKQDNITEVGHGYIKPPDEDLAEKDEHGLRKDERQLKCRVEINIPNDICI